MTDETRVEIGGVARAHGIRGEVVIVTHDPDSDTLGHVERVFIAGAWRTIAHARDTHRGWLVQIEGIATRNDAELLRGKPVEVARADLDLAGDDVLLQDLVGCKVVLTDGTPWGEIAAIDAGPGQDRLVIHDRGVERLVPVVDVFVVKVDVEARVVTVDPPEGTPETKL